MILTPMLTLCPRYADLAPGTVPLSGQEVRVVPNDPDMPIPVAFSGPSSSEGSALPVPVEDRVVAHAHCPVVTVNGPGPIVGQDYDRIVLGWTEGTTGRRARRPPRKRRRCGDRYSALSPFHRRLRCHRHFPPKESTLSKCSSTRCVGSRAPYPGLEIDVTHRTGQVDTELERSLDRAALLVVGSHHSEQSWSIRVGPIAEELIRPVR